MLFVSLFSHLLVNASLILLNLTKFGCFSLRAVTAVTVQWHCAHSLIVVVILL